MVSPGELRDKWMNASTWPVPDWFLNASVQDSVRNFQSLSAHHLRARYVELEGDFRTIVANFAVKDFATADAIFRHLQVIRDSLSRTRPQLLACASTLDLVERYMVWIYPPHVLGDEDHHDKHPARSALAPRLGAVPRAAER